MSNRQFKSQASSSRAASSGGGFGGFGFGSASTGSVLSYLTPPPDLRTVSDANVVVAFKGLSKKDATTKTKALEDLRQFVHSPPPKQEAGVETAILDAWLQFYPRVAIDNSRRVRELAHQLQHDLTSSTKKRMEKHLPEFAGTWLAGMYDKDRAVSKAAKDCVTSFLDTEDKLLKFWKLFQPQILDYARGALNETPQSLCDERSMSPDEIQETYFRVVGSSVSLVVNLLSQLDKADLLKYQDRYDLFFNNNSTKLWTLIACEEAFVRRLVAQLLLVCLKKQRGVVEANLDLLSKSFISEALRSPQTMSAYQLLEALKSLTTKNPEVWTSSYRAKKPALSKLQNFIAKGSQGGPVMYWQSLQSLLGSLPDGILPAEIGASLEFFKSLRDGINSREEPKSNSALAWSSYFHIADLLVKLLPDESTRGKLFQQAIFPVFEQYLHPSLDNSKWSLGDNTSAIAKAYVICASATDTTFRTSLSQELQRLSDDFIFRLRTSLPEQSKDYDVSQASVIAEAHRWFKFINDVFVLLPGGKTTQILEQQSSSIISIALATVKNRNGKAYSAAATIEAALRYTPQLFRNSVNMDALKSFLDEHLSSLIISPSMKYLVSILHGLRFFSEEKPFFANIWQSTIYDLLRLPPEAEADQLRALTALLASHDVVEIAEVNSSLQDYLYSLCIKALHGDHQAWPVFEAAVTFHTIATALAKKLINQILPGLDVTNIYLEYAFKALELFGKKNNELLQDYNIQIVLLTKLLALSEVRNNAGVLSRAVMLRSLLERSDEDSQRVDTSKNKVVSIMHEHLEAASPQSLLIGTLMKEARLIMSFANTPELKKSLLPHLPPWRDALMPFLEKRPNSALGVIRPFAGAAFLVSMTKKPFTSDVPRDTIGYSVPLRSALYTIYLLGLEDFTQFIPQDLQVQYLYFLALTYELVNDQIDLVENNMLFESHLDPDSMAEIRRMLTDITSSFSAITSRARSWRDNLEDRTLPAHDTSLIVRDLIRRFVNVAGSPMPQGYYAGKALCRFLQILWISQDRMMDGGDDWLAQLGIMTTTTQNIFGASAILIGFGDNLLASKVVNNMCNHLISDLASASPEPKTLQKLVLLNSCLIVYDTEESEVPVAQNRLIFAVKQILSWSEIMSAKYIELASEACRALQRLLPAIKDVYGTYWEGALNLCIAIWGSAEDGYLSDERIPAIGMSLKLISILQNMEDANDDLMDALVKSNKAISIGLVNLLKLQRSKVNMPLQYVDDLLSRQVVNINPNTVKDLSEFYPLVASDFRTVQSAAFDVLQKTLILSQQQISVDVALSKTDAALSEELLSLLLDAPIFNDYSDQDLAQFPISVRRYLLSWHLVFDSFSSASNKVRDDYSATIKNGDYIGPLLTFMFDVLGHSFASPLKLDKERFNEAMVRKYDLWVASDFESDERNMQWLLVNLYYLSLKYIPGLVKDWWLNCKVRQTSIAVEAWTEKYYSTLIVQDLLDDVISWSKEQTTESEDEKTLVIKVSKNSREVFAGYEIDELMMQIVIRLPVDYPLKIATVESVNRVGIKENKWANFIMITQGVIAFTNGSIVDGLETFRRNVVGALKGHVECAICYSIVSSEKKLPDQQCATCRNLFHNDCLHKWFKSSNANLCPLCRNPFNYSANVSRRSRERAGQP